MDLVTEAARALVGVRSDWVEATHPVEASEVRRFVHATMDPAPRYREEAPLGFPVHAFRRPASQREDPLEGRGDPEFDGESRLIRLHLPRMPVKLSGVLNGGYEYEFLSRARIGERIFARSAYRDVRQRQGRSGPMVLVVVDDEFAAGEERRPLLRSTTTLILR